MISNISHVLISSSRELHKSGRVLERSRRMLAAPPRLLLLKGRAAANAAGGGEAEARTQRIGAQNARWRRRALLSLGKLLERVCSEGRPVSSRIVKLWRRLSA